MISILINAIKIIFLLGFLIFIHEGGHFLIAKACKIKVNEFAIGFGPTIWERKTKETRYALRLIPLGGFVSMLGETERSEKEGSFSKAKVWKRICIVVAGAIVNIIFALVLYFILASSTENYVSTTIQDIMEQSAAQEVDLMQGDKIIEINNKKVRFQYDLVREINNSQGNELKVLIERNGIKQEKNITPMQENNKSIGIYLGIDGENLTTQIKGIYKESPAEKEGLIVGDTIISVDGKDVNSNPYNVVEYISNSENDKINIKIERNQEIKEFNIIPEIDTNYIIGVSLEEVDKGILNSIYYGFWDTVQFSKSIIENLKLIFRGNVHADQLMGPIGISEVVSKTEGIKEFLYMMSLISLSLGVTNLLPFPPLDGGKIVFLVIEAIRKKPLKENIEIGIQMIGFVMIICLSLYITYKDVIRIL